MKKVFAILFLVPALAVAQAVTNAQYLMVDESGKVVPEGYTMGLSDIAASAASVAAASNAAVAVAEATVNASNIVNSVIASVTGAYGFGYIEGYLVSFGDSVSVSTNASCSIVKVEIAAAGTTNINSEEYSGHYFWYVYTEPMPSVPFVKWKRALDASNEWHTVEFQETEKYENVTIGGTTYGTAYRSTVWMPSSYNSSFFLTYCEITGGGGSGELLDVYGGLSVNGNAGYSGAVTNSGVIETYLGGVLIKKEEE